MRRIVLLTLLLGALATTLVALWGLRVIDPDARVPIHWDLHGRPDRFAPRNLALLVYAASAMSVAVGGYAVSLACAHNPLVATGAVLAELLVAVAAFGAVMFAR